MKILTNASYFAHRLFLPILELVTAKLKKKSFSIYSRTNLNSMHVYNKEKRATKAYNIQTFFHEHTNWRFQATQLKDKELNLNLNAAVEQSGR